MKQGYGLRPIAMRTLERAFNALSLATAAVRGGQVTADSEAHLELAQRLASESRGAYRRLVYETPEFYEFFQAVTPIDVIERMQIGSRSVHRSANAGLAALLPVPWVFAWSQARYMLPGWFGAGSGLAAAVEALGLARMREAYGSWFFLRNLIDDVETMLARADLEIARYYEALAPKARAASVTPSGPSTSAPVNRCWRSRTIASCSTPTPPCSARSGCATRTWIR